MGVTVSECKCAIPKRHTRPSGMVVCTKCGGLVMEPPPPRRDQP